MTDTVTAVAQGNGTENTFQMLISMVGRLSEIGATLKSVDAGLIELRQNTSQQLSLLQERVGRSEALNEVQNERIKQGEESDKQLRQEIAALKMQHAQEITELKVQNERELEKLRIEMEESKRQRWTIRGGLLVVAVLWPIVWELGILPLFGR